MLAKGALYADNLTKELEIFGNLTVRDYYLFRYYNLWKLASRKLVKSALCNHIACALPLAEGFRLVNKNVGEISASDIAKIISFPQHAKLIAKSLVYFRNLKQKISLSFVGKAISHI